MKPQTVPKPEPAAAAAGRTAGRVRRALAGRRPGAAAGTARAAAAPQGPARDMNDLRASICAMPPQGPLQSAVGRARISGTMKLQLTFTADGSVTDVSVAQSSRDRNVDRAAQSWARRIKMCAGQPGSGILPLGTQAITFFFPLVLHSFQTEGKRHAAGNH
jgi:protein TonB